MKMNSTPIIEYFEISLIVFCFQELISSWRKWDTMRPGPPRWMSNPNLIAKDHLGTHRRLSGSVCGQDPR